MRSSASRPSLLTALAAVGLAAAVGLSGCTGSAGPSSGGKGTSGSQASDAPQGSASPSASPEAEPTKPIAEPKAPTSPLKSGTKTTVWKDNAEVSHLFFHSLIVDPKVAFKDRESGKGYADYMVTVSEFKKMLKQIYAKNYVLVSPRALATVSKNGKVTPTDLKVPKGKKPLVLSIDDVSYYEYMKGDGFATKLLIDKDGRVRNEYTDPETKKTSVGAYDVMPIVDDFVKEHPDFAPYGNKGVVALTGYNGVLGYRSSPSVYKGKNKNLDKDITTATQVANAMKKEGWEFASHSWGHINFTKSPVQRIKTDTARWKKDVQPIIGPTDLLVYPFGADLAGIEQYHGAKFDYLKDQGFDFYFNVDGSTPAWGQFGPKYLREARFNIDGISLKAAVDGRKPMYQFFDPKTVIDPARPKSISGTT